MTSFDMYQILTSFLDDLVVFKNIYLWCQGAGLGSLSEMDDLATTFAKVSFLFFADSHDVNSDK